MHTPRDAVVQIRASIDLIDRYLAEERPPIIAASAGTDIIAIPFHWCADPIRSEITRRVFRHLRRVAEECGVRVIGLGSEGDVSKSLWCEFFLDVDYSEFPQPWEKLGPAGGAGLRTKFNETIRRAHLYDPARVFIGGSDDVIPIEWFRRAFKSEADLVGVKGGARVLRFDGSPRVEMWQWDGRYASQPDIEFCGGGVVLGRRLLDAWGWVPFDAPSDEVRVERRARSEGWVVEGIDVGEMFHAVKAPRAVLNDARMAARYGAQPCGPEAVAGFWRIWNELA